MITRITNTPVFYSALNSQSRNQNIKNTKIQNDNVTFTSKFLKTQDIVDLAFKELAKNRSDKNLGIYLGKIGNTNVHIIETELGKKAQLNLMRKNGFANFEISRSSDQPATISYNGNDMSSSILANAVSRLIKK